MFFGLPVKKYFFYVMFLDKFICVAFFFSSVSDLDYSMFCFFSMSPELYMFQARNWWRVGGRSPLPFFEN